MKDNNDRWKRVVDTCLKVGEEVLGTKDKSNNTKDLEIKRLSEMRQTIKRQMIDTTSQNKKAKLRLESKYIKKEINQRLKKKEEKEI